MRTYISSIVAAVLLLFGQVGQIPIVDTGNPVVAPCTFSPSAALDAWPMCEGSGLTINDIAASNPINVPISNLAAAGVWGAVAGFPPTPFSFNTSASRIEGIYKIGATSPNWAFATWDMPFSNCTWLEAITFNTPSTESALIGNIDSSNNYSGWETEVLQDSGGDGHVIFVISNNVFTPLWARVATASSTMTHSAIHQVCATYDGGRHASGMLVYIDGALSATSTLADTLGSGNAPINNIGIGNRISSSGSFTNPLWATQEFTSIWPCALSSGVIATNYAAGPSFTGLHC